MLRPMRILCSTYSKPSEQTNSKLLSQTCVMCIRDKDANPAHKFATEDRPKFGVCKVQA